MAKKAKYNKEETKALKKRAFWKQKYKDYYSEDGNFNHDAYRTIGRPHIVAELLIYALFAVFIAWGVFNAYKFFEYAQANYSFEVDQATGIAEQYGAILANELGRIFAYVIVSFIITLIIGWTIIKIFGKMAWVLMYTSVIVQTYGCWELYNLVEGPESLFPAENPYSYLILAPILLNFLIMTIYHKRFSRAIKFLKNSCNVVVSQKQLVIPQLTQTLIITILSAIYSISSLGYFYQVTGESHAGNFYGYSVEITNQEIFYAITILYVFLVYIVYNTTKVMKILMVHAWYRGSRVGFFRSYRMVRYRFWGIITFSLLATISHTYKMIKEMLKGTFGPKSAKEAKNFYKKIKPADMESLNPEDLKNMPWVEKLFYYINYYVLYSVAIENKSYIRALFRSIHITLKNIPDLYIKKAHTNTVLAWLRYTLLIAYAGIGGAIGYYVGDKVFGMDNAQFVALGGAGIFTFIGKFTINMFINDLNMAYKCMMYMHTIDELYDKKGYTRFELTNPLNEKEQKDLDEEWDKKDKKAFEKREKYENKQKDKEEKVENESEPAPEVTPEPTPEQ